MKTVRINAIMEILEECGIMPSAYNVQNIAEAISDTIDAELEMESYQHVSGSKECPECAKLKSRLEEAETNREIFRKQLQKVYNADSVSIFNGDVIINHKSYML